MRRVSLQVLLLFCVVALVACQVPTPPSLTETPTLPAITPTHDAATPMAHATTPAPIEQGIPSLTPLQQPTATYPAEDVPSGWVQYNAFTELFSFYYPPTWEIDHESVNEVRIYADDRAGIILGVYETFCGINDGITPTNEILICLAAAVSDEMGIYGRYRHIAKEHWDNVYTIEHILYMPDEMGGEDDEPVYHLRMFVAITEGLIVDCVYFHRGTTFITDAERNTLERIIRSFRIRHEYILTPTPLYDGISSVS
ncbi:MAG TPA: hypothetical protein GX702_12035 [Chloroflexi bacterium]|nr:hypothetical protein [Chloroflexota bacterium]